MSFFIDLLKPAPAVEEIKDQDVVNKDYKYWRMRILYSMFVGYAFYYFTRKSFTFAMPDIISELGFDKGQLGLLGSVFSITYGISKFASGIMSDRCNPRYFMAFGLMLTGLWNIFFGFSSSLILFIFFWGLNGWFQGWGWPPCARFLTQWYSQSERGSWWSIWNVSHNVGAFIIPWVVGFFLEYYGGWRFAMVIPGIICIFGGFFLINRLRDTPESLGLPPVEKYRNEPLPTMEEKAEDKLTNKEILWKYVINNKYIWILAVAYFFVYFVRTGINDWTALFLIETKGYSRIGANGCVSLFEVGGLFGALSAGFISDRVFGAKRGPINVLYSIGMLIAVSLFWFVPAGNPLLDSVSIFMIGFSVFGPQMVIGMAAAELSHKKAASSSTGFVGCAAYIGAAVAGGPLGWLTESLGWNGFFYALVVCCGVSILLLVPMWGITAANRKLNIKPEKEVTPEKKYA